MQGLVESRAGRALARRSIELVNYERSTLRTRVEQWKQEGKTHRLGALVQLVNKHISLQALSGKLPDLRSDRRTLRSLKRLSEHFGEEQDGYGLRCILNRFGLLGRSALKRGL